MIEDRVQMALTKLFHADCFAKQSQQYELEEKDNGGRSLLKLNVSSIDNLCVPNYDKNKWLKFKFLKVDKCVDHFLLMKNNDRWELHIIEMKTTIGNKTWEETKLQFKESYLKIKAIAVFLGIELSDDKIFVHTTYENDEITSLDKNEFNQRRQPLGRRIIDLKRDEWDVGKVSFFMTNHDVEPIWLNHDRLQMYRDSDDILKGDLRI